MVFYRQWRAVFPAIVLVGAFYIYEDVIATARGNWSFAPELTGELLILGLPLGEWLFFITVPYACIFIYACVRGYVREKQTRVPRWIPLAVAVLAVIAAWMFRNQGYTVVVMGVTGATALLLAVVRPDLLGSRQFRIAMAFSYGMFLIVNGFLTGIPVVLYGENAIWGIRVITIPLEDFFYNFCLLSLNFLFYRLFLDRFPPVRSAAQPGWTTVSPDVGCYAGPAGVGSTKAPVKAFRFLEKDHGR